MKWYKMLSDHSDNKLAIESKNKAIKTGIQQPSFELEVITKSGERKWLEISEAPVVENNQVISIVGASIDITERKKNEKQLLDSELK